MAIVEGPALSLRASGNVGSLCYTKYRGQAVCRDAWTLAGGGTYISTSAQIVIQGYMRLATRAWSGSCSQAERDEWEAFARGQRWTNRLSQKWQPTGYNVFIRMACISLTLGESIQTTPPLVISHHMPELFTVTDVGGVGAVEVEFSDFPAGEEPDYIQVWISGPYARIGRKPIEPEYRYKGKAASPFIFTSGALVAGSYYWIRARWADSIGTVGNWYTMQHRAVILP